MPSTSVLCGQLLVVGLAGTELEARETRALASGVRGGVVLFRRNIGPSMAGVAKLNASVQAAMPEGVPALIAVDQEGGRVVRLGPPAMPLPPMRRLGDIGDTELLASTAEAHARELKALGFTMSFAPVADVHTRPENPIIGDRAFAETPEAVARYAGAWADGLSRAGILTCAKHVPGHGDTTVDSHLALPRVERARAELDRIEIAPFRALAQRPSIDAMMTAHVVYPALDAERPATLSHAVCTDLIRRELGFQGVLFSDDLEMKAIAQPVSEAAVAAIAAGCDVLLVCSKWELAEEAHEALVREAEKSAAFRSRCEEAYGRALAMRTRAVPTPITDERALGAVFEATKPASVELERRLAAGASS
ncbi:Beta-hexosaminidase [Labilithrix luteola]|uniref:Beta-hexosaminidase n=1 Tax=Labilithrix luteola TaxID=1391654 RepID=A0A0K1Q8L5_9BACT|nr:beta-N-acetylhexosaminidase [Labilithrix luteola]AKV02151.1 Beta-hexosaminidase [Labilithrix luteola]